MESSSKHVGSAIHKHVATKVRWIMRAITVESLSHHESNGLIHSDHVRAAKQLDLTWKAA